jgi:hypothetical protein
MKYAWILVFTSVIWGCMEKRTQTKPKIVVVAPDTSRLDLHEPSEMAVAMNDFYAFDAKIRKRILEGEPLGEFPEEWFLRIHTATLTDTDKRTQEFEVFADLFVQAHRDIYDTSLDTPLTARYNTAVDLCISCHRNSCPGPISRIEKLRITP